jgi:phosphoserine phosphatase RsbU/P
VLRTPEARAAFQAYRDGLIHSWSATVTVLGFSLIPLFLILDYYTMPPELLSRFAVYRGVATFAVLVQHFIIRKTRPGHYSYLHGYFFTMLVGGMIVWMTVDLGGFNHGYYAGLILVIVAVNLLLPWRAVHSATNGALVLTLYVLANAFFGGDFELKYLINNLYFLGSTVVIAVAINHAKHRLIEDEFYLRADLLEANEKLDRSRHELKAARDALWGEMEVAKRIQTALLPKNRKVGSYEVAALMNPADEVGGDYYDIIETAAGEQWVAIGDVSGHGVESGLVMMMTQTSILSMVTNLPNLKPSGVFDAINRVLRENISRLNTHRYMSLNIVRAHADRLTVAGKHQDILVFRKARGAVEQIANEGCWLGVVPETRGQVDDLDIPMEAGDIALFFTDGVTEAANETGEMFGEERLSAAFQKAAQLPLEAALDRLVAEVRAFQARQDDDITLMLLRRA